MLQAKQQGGRSLSLAASLRPHLVLCPGQGAQGLSPLGLLSRVLIRQTLWGIGHALEVRPQLPKSEKLELNKDRRIPSVSHSQGVCRQSQQWLLKGLEHGSPQSEHQESPWQAAIQPRPHRLPLSPVLAGRICCALNVHVPLLLSRAVFLDDTGKHKGICSLPGALEIGHQFCPCR